MDRHGKELVLVFGSRGSGADLLTHVLDALGFHLPDPASVAVLHEQALRRAVVEAGDARPVAWARCAQVGARSKTRSAVKRLLGTPGFRPSLMAVTDPHLHWFYPVWRDAATQLGTRVSSITLLQHPSTAIADHVAGGYRSPNSRAAGWINAMLYSERATRGTPRAFASHDAIVADWTIAVSDIDRALGIGFLATPRSGALTAASDLVTAATPPPEVEWPGAEMAPEVRDLAEAVWAGMSMLKHDAEDDKALAKLDDCRSRYLELYEVAESVTASSAAAEVQMALNARKATNRAMESALRVGARVPDHWRQRLPRRLIDKLKDQP